MILCVKAGKNLVQYMNMKTAFILLAVYPLCGAFRASLNGQRRSQWSQLSAIVNSDANVVSRADFVKRVAVATSASLLIQQPAFARGRATLDKSYERYTPRIIAGGQFYGSDLRKIVERGDFAALKNALQEPPERQKADLNKPDSGVAERARQAGQFSDARVVNAMDLYAAAFSDNSISAKTKKMKGAAEKVRECVDGMSSVARQALGEETSGGFFGIGGKKPSGTELAKKLREYYVYGGNAFNEYVFAANEDLALKFDKLPYIRA